MYRGYGCKRQLPDRRDHRYRLRSIHVGPSIDLRSKMPPITDQSYLGACTAGMIDGLLRYDRLKQGLSDLPTSRLFQYYNERLLEGTVDQDAGATLRDTVQATATYGYCSEDDWGYNIPLFTAKPPQKSYDDALPNRITDYAAVDQTEAALKNAIASGFPVGFGFVVYESFESPEASRTGIIPLPGPNEVVLGGHAIALVGYDDSKQQFIFRNDWGSGWGAAGYGFIPYSYVLGSLAFDFWVINSVPSTMNGAKLVSLSVPTTASLGQTLSVSAVLLNNGTTTWDPNQYQLAVTAAGYASWPGDPTRVKLPSPVAPNQQVTLNFNVTAPKQPGSYLFDWQMIYGGIIEWFGDHLTQNVTVTNSPPPPPQPDTGDIVSLPFRNDTLDPIGIKLFNTNNLPMDGQEHRIRRTWRGNRPLKFVFLDVIPLALYGNIADMGMSLWRIRLNGTEELIREVGWDHYQSPTHPNNIPLYLTNSPILLLPNESIELRYVFTPLGDPNSIRQGQVVVNGLAI